MNAWTVDGKSLALLQQDKSKDDPEPKALACFGALDHESGKVLLRFSNGQPNSTYTLQFIEYLLSVAKKRRTASIGGHLGQGELAQERASQSLGESIQPERKAGGRSQAPHLVATHQESLAQSTRTPLDALQKACGRASRNSDSVSTQRTCPRLF